MEVDFKQEWYGIQSKIIEQTDDFIVIDYGCRGHGIITNYFLFDGIQLCFLDFDTSESMPSQNLIRILSKLHIVKKEDMNVNLQIIQYLIYQRAILELQERVTYQYPFLFH